MESQNNASTRRKPSLPDSLIPIHKLLSATVHPGCEQGDLSTHHKAAKQAVKVHRHRSKCYFSAVK